MKYHHKFSTCSINLLAKDIGRVLFDKYFSKGNVGLLCSATLAVEQNFQYFKSQIGLNHLSFSRDINEEFFSTPFLLEEQIKFYAFKTDLNINSRDYLDNIAEQIYGISECYEKRMLVLCTSYKQASELKNRLYSKFIGSKTNLYVHERGRSKNSLLRSFKNSPGSILIGTMAFWEGVDLPGDLLEVLMIIKMPFDVPTDPIVKAYGGMIESQGGNSFMDYALPESVIRFRQGFGRLIRTSYDEGIFIVMDDRIINKRYGALFSESIPVQMQVFKYLDDLSYP